MEKPLVLITGAAGLFGGILRNHWGDRYRLRLTDIRPLNNLAPHEEFIGADITQLDALIPLCQGVDTVVHLAADPDPHDRFYQSLLQRNIVGAYNIFTAAQQAGCRRLVFASSIDAVRGWWERGEIAWDAPVYPTNIYGASKCWGEALGRVYAEAGLSCICVRLCNPHFDQSGDWDPEQLTSGISPRDAAHLFARCIDVEEINFALVNGISRHRRGRLDWKIAHQVLGYEPQDGTAFPRTD
ncbi:MAG: NAD-dependent epimerase/dehydratase family protein [Candidatus Latescibacteria bacterium]|nr:NAD-dependent epimerase/dehydratase family protein [Candidatus Latescibacterota bacterium]